jgi:hypothetical protein
MKLCFNCWLLLAITSIVASAEHSIARVWNEQNLAAIRTAFPDPPVHARNLFHTSVAMWDAWAAYEPSATGYLHNETATAADIEAARHRAISYAAYRVLTDRYLANRHPNTPQTNADAVFQELNAQMAAFGYPTAFTSTLGSDPAAVGNRAAATVLAFAATDGSREETGYDDPTYAPINQPLVIALSGTTMNDPNRWQPLAFASSVNTQNGIVLPGNVQTYVGAHWGGVRPFALHYEDNPNVYHDPGPPPYISNQAFKENNLEVIRLSSWLDPTDTRAEAIIDISPRAVGNNTLGLNDGTGHPLNPSTGLPYPANFVHRGDFGRVVAEYWADGPSSETPPGHWNRIANEVSAHPEFIRKIGGTGPLLGPLEWDVKLYFTLNAALHDVAVAVWGCKRYYDYVRPISSIRYMGGLGQSSDPNGFSYHPDGLPLEPGLVEVITPWEPRGFPPTDYGKIALYAWGGEPNDRENDFTGAKWILAEDWIPYQRNTFVTPAFAGYVSGHSGFSQAGAEVLTQITGSPFFPSGLGTHTAFAGSLEFEAGPATDVVLQWATYYDAADQAGFSRLYGGIHVAADDGPGRIIGSECGLDAWLLATSYIDSSILQQPFTLSIDRRANGDTHLCWPQQRGLFYSLQSAPTLNDFQERIPASRAKTDIGSTLIPAEELIDSKHFFKVIQSAKIHSETVPVK